MNQTHASNASVFRGVQLAWFLRGAIERVGLANTIGDDFAANRYGPYSDKVRHLLNSMDGSYLACETRVADARVFDPIRFNDARRDLVAAYLTTSEAKPYRPALDHATEVIEGFVSPHGLELLATVDWLNRHENVGMDSAGMMAAIRTWPGPDGAAERKARIFNERHMGIAIDHLLQVAGPKPDWVVVETVGKPL